MIKEKSAQILENNVNFKQVRANIKRKIDTQSAAASLIFSLEKSEDNSRKNEKKKEFIDNNILKLAQEKEKNENQLLGIENSMEKEKQIIMHHKQKWDALKQEKIKLVETLAKSKEQADGWEEKRMEWSHDNKENYASTMDKTETIKSNIRNLALELGCSNSENIQFCVNFLSSYKEESLDQIKTEQNVLIERQIKLHADLQKLRADLTDLWAKIEVPTGIVVQNHPTPPILLIPTPRSACFIPK